jgi:hypothetical protein
MSQRLAESKPKKKGQRNRHCTGLCELRALNLEAALLDLKELELELELELIQTHMTQKPLLWVEAT